MKVTLNELFNDKTWELYSITTPTYSSINYRYNARLDKMQFETYLNENFLAPMDCKVYLNKSKDKCYDIKTYYFDDATKLELYFPTSLKIFQDSINTFYR